MVSLLGKGGSKKRKKNPVTVRRVVGRLNPTSMSALQRHPPHVVVGTPRSLQAALDESFLATSEVFCCVFDEADHLVQDFSQEQMVNFLRPRDNANNWQLVFVTASVTPAVEKVAEKYMAKPYLNTRDGMVVHRDASGNLVFGENPEEATSLATRKPKRIGPVLPTVQQIEAEDDQRDRPSPADSLLGADADEDEEKEEEAADGDLDQDEIDEKLSPFVNSDGSLKPASEVKGTEKEGSEAKGTVVRRTASRVYEYSHLSLPDPATRPAPPAGFMDDLEQNMPTVTHQLLAHSAENLEERMTLFRRWYNAARPAQLLVFVRDNATAVQLFDNLKTNRFSVMQLLNDTPKEIRYMAIRRLARRNLRVLITTDMGSRGLHFPQLTHVVNFDSVDNPLQYLHRAGRVGRLNGRRDNPGVVSFCSQEEAMLLYEYGNRLNLKLEPIAVIQHSVLYENPPVSS